jgi:hypothetical protein
LGRYFEICTLNGAQSVPVVMLLIAGLTNTVRGKSQPEGSPYIGNCWKVRLIAMLEKDCKKTVVKLR